MDKGEKIFLFLTTAFLAMLVIWRLNPQNGILQSEVSGSEPGNILDHVIGSSQTKPAINGISYLTFNQSWGFAPPVQNALPTLNAWGF